MLCFLRGQSKLKIPEIPMLPDNSEPRYSVPQRYIVQYIH